MAGSKKTPTNRLSRQKLLDIYYYLKLNRALDTKISNLYRQGKFRGGAFISRGQEGISVGSAFALAEGDVIGPMIRNSGAVLVRGITPTEFLANYLGKVTGPTRGKDGNSHFGDIGKGVIAPISMLGASIPVGAGAALAFKMRGQRNVALTWIGDGGSSVGDFHEGLNFAAVKKLPLVVILENNGYAYSTPVEKQSLVKDFVVRADSYGIPGEIVDGNDVLAVYEATFRAVGRARKGGGPALIEAKTFRMTGHAEHDDASYVPQRLHAAWQRKDPIARFEKYLLEHARIPAQELQALSDRASGEIDQAERSALAAPLPEPGSAAEGLYAP